MAEALGVVDDDVERHRAAERPAAERDRVETESVEEAQEILSPDGIGEARLGRTRKSDATRTHSAISPGAAGDHHDGDKGSL